MLEERHKRSGDGDELLGADVDVVHFVPADQDKVTGLAGVDQFGNDLAFVIEFHIGLRDGVTIFFPCGEVEGERLNRRRLLPLLF